MSSHRPHARLLETLASLRDLPDGADPVAALVSLVNAIRPGRSGDASLARARFAFLVDALENDAATRQAVQACVFGLLSGRKQVSYFADSGILPGSGFFSELWRRIVQRAFPAIPDTAYLRDALRLMFHRLDDADWVEAIDEKDTMRFARALLRDAPAGLAALQETMAQVLDAADVLATRIGAMGLEPELIRLYPRIEERGSPFLALAIETHDLSASYRAYLSGAQAPAEDERQLGVLIDQCREVLQRVHARASAVGTSLALTYLMRRLEQSLERLEILVRMLSARHAQAAVDADATTRMWVGFVTQSIRGESLRQGIRGHIGRTIGLLALRVTDNARRTGEHYITTSREEYFAMWRSAMWAGFVVGFMALIKVYSAKAALPPLGYALAYSLNYSLGFILIHVLHFTLATKQPAMTASTIAGVLGDLRGRVREIDRLATLVIDLIRSQLAAITGNILVVIPTAMLLAAIVGQWTGAPIMGAEKARHLLTDISPVDSLALFHAAVAGVCLFIGGLISGYYDNLAAYERVSERVQHTQWLRALLGEARLARLAAYLDANLGALAGNFFLGVMLAATGTLGFLTGLPLDVRHVTLSSANFGLAMVALGFDVDALTIAKCLAGIALIGALNLTVSFSLALWVAMRSRGAAFSQTGELLMALWRRWRANARQFVWPPANGGPGP